MSNILRVTTPMTGYDNAAYQRGEVANKPDARIQGPVDPTRVARPDARSDSAAEEQNVGLKFQYQSNFEGFLNQLRETGAMTEEFSSVFFERVGNQVKAGLAENSAQEMARFMEMIQVNPENMLSFVKGQGDSAVRFQGAFFNLLRQAMGESKNVEFKATVLDFIKRYTDMAEGEHILREIKHTISEIKSGMFQSGKEEMAKLEEQIEYGQAGKEEAVSQNAQGAQDAQAAGEAGSAGDLKAIDALLAQLNESAGEESGAVEGESEERGAVYEENLKEQAEQPGLRGDTQWNASIIKGKMLPYLNKYISSIHDRGFVRENTVHLAALTARYENGDAGRVLERFEELMEYPVMQKYFKGFDKANLLRVLASTDFEKAVGKNQWMKEFVSMIKDGMLQGNNLEQKQVFRNMMTSILLNESVYMPVLHMVLPMQVEDKLMFGEMWIDPDAGNGASEDGEGRVVQGLVKFDIKDVGFFDLFFICQNKKVNMQLHYPEALKDKEGEIRDKLGEILTRNGLESQELFLGISSESIAISDAFPQIFERKNSVNVKI